MIELSLTNASYIVFGLVAFVGLAQLFFAFLYSLVLRFRKSIPRQQGKENHGPTLVTDFKVAVILSLRGSDPDLRDNLKNLLCQDYSNYHIFVVVDHPDDSAWQDVHRWIAEAPDRITAWSLENRQSTCSLKSSAIAEALDKYGAAYDVWAFIDGDAHPHSKWISDLTKPLADPNVGVSAGNRWFVPVSLKPGTMARYFWNIGAVVQVWWNGLTWGGSMALRWNTIEQVQLIDSLRTSFVDDGAVIQQIKKFGYRAHFEPTVIMPNRESMRVGQFIPWATRQLVAARSSGAGWAVVLFHASLICGSVCLPVLLLCLSAISSNLRAVQVNLISIATHWSLALLASWLVEMGMRYRLRINGHEPIRMNFAFLIRCLPGIVGSHFLYWVCLVRAHFCSRISWRGIEYDIERSGTVRMREYRTFRNPALMAEGESII